MTTHFDDIYRYGNGRGDCIYYSLSAIDIQTGEQSNDRSGARKRFLAIVTAFAGVWLSRVRQNAG